MKKGMVTYLILISYLFAEAQSNVNETITEGNQYYRNAQFEQAEQRYRAALEKEPGNSIAQMNLANALSKQRKWDEAIKIYNGVATTVKEPKVKAVAHYNEGALYSKQKELDKSIEAYKAALRMDPDDKQARENLQKALLEKKKQQSSSSEQNQQKSPMSQSEAERQLKQLQEKEKNIQQRLNKKGQGGSMQKDW
jgi:Ca-activated chloride channel family protein